MESPGHVPNRELAPFRIEPRFVKRVWGFEDLRPWYDWVAASEPRSAEAGAHRESSEAIGEVWLTGDECRVGTGSFAGKSLAAVFAEAHDGLLGREAPSPTSPLLIKVIFAKEKLSVQVHPDDKMAQKYGEPRGKTECWYALAAEPGAKVAAGLKAGVTLEQIKEEIHAGTLEESLNVLDVAPGDMVMVDAGTVHAIWPGSILLEVQQNCDLTYRLYDYGRPRELHIEKGLEATKLVTQAGKVPPTVMADRTVLVDSEYFRVERLGMNRSWSNMELRGANLRGSAQSGGVGKAAGLQYLFAAAGAARVVGAGFEAIDLPTRGIVAVPAGSPEFRIEDRGRLELIRITPNWPGKTAP